MLASATWKCSRACRSPSCIGSTALGVAGAVVRALLAVDAGGERVVGAQAVWIVVEALLLAGHVALADVDSLDDPLAGGILIALVHLRSALGLPRAGDTGTAVVLVVARRVHAAVGAATVPRLDGARRDEERE